MLNSNAGSVFRVHDNTGPVFEFPCYGEWWEGSLWVAHNERLPLTSLASFVIHINIYSLTCCKSWISAFVNDTPDIALLFNQTTGWAWKKNNDNITSMLLIFITILQVQLSPGSKDLSGGSSGPVQVNVTVLLMPGGGWPPCPTSIPLPISIAIGIWMSRRRQSLVNTPRPSHYLDTSNFDIRHY